MQITITAPVVLSTNGRPQESINGYRVEIVDAPELTGSEKQVAWAEAIRTAAVEDMAKSLRNAKLRTGRRLDQHNWREPEWEEDLALVNEMLAMIAGKLASVTSAKAWIEAAGGSKSQSTIRALIK